MTRLLEEALDRVRRLTPKEQDAIASLILSEIEDEQQWDVAFGRSQELLKQMADHARAEAQAGQAPTAGFDEI